MSHHSIHLHGYQFRITETDGGQIPESAQWPETTALVAVGMANVHAGEDGRVFVVFRSATEKVNRDIHVLASKDFNKTFEIASVDPWEVGTCVMSTAAFASRGEDVLAAWETKDRVRLADLGGGKSVGRAVSMPRGEKNQKHPSVAVNGRGEYVVVWTEGTGWGKGGDLNWQVFDAKGNPSRGARATRTTCPSGGCLRPSRGRRVRLPSFTNPESLTSTNRPVRSAVGLVRFHHPQETHAIDLIPIGGMSILLAERQVLLWKPYRSR